MSSSVPAVAGGRTSEQFVRYLAQLVASLGSTATDFNRLSVLRTIAEMVALLGERFEEDVLVRTAEGIDAAAFRSFGFTSLPASNAYGSVTFTRTFSGTDLTNGTAISALTIPANTAVRVPNTTKQFFTYADNTFPAFTQNGATTTQILTVQVIASGVGSAWNTNAATVTEIVTPIQVTQGVLTVTNQSDITTGADDETDEARRLRFAAYIQGIHRATADAISAGVKQNAYLVDPYGVITERIYSSQTVDGTLAATATCYIWNGNQTAPAVSTQLQQLAQAVVTGPWYDSSGNKQPGYKAAGASVSVVPATLVPANVTVAVYPAPGFSLSMVEQSVISAVLRVFARMQVGDDSLKLSDLRYAVGTVRGIIDHAFALPAPLANPVAAPNVAVVAVPGGAANPSAAPVVGTTSVTSTLVSGNWNVAYTFYNANGETQLSAVSPVTLATSDNLGITVGAITLPANTTGVRYYLNPPGYSVYGLAGTSNTGGATTLTSAPDTNTVPPISNTTGTPVSGAAFLTAGNYQVEFSYAAAGGQTASSIASNTVAIASGQAIKATVPGNIVDPVLAPTVTTTTTTSTLAAGNYIVGYSYYNAAGETVLSPTTTVNVATANTYGIVISPVNVPTNATGVHYYWEGPGHSTYGFAGTNTNGAQITIAAPANYSSAPTTVNTTGTLPAGATGINWYISEAPFTTTPTALAYATQTTGNTVTLGTLPTDTTLIAPSANTSANIGGGDGKIIVPGTISVVAGS